MGDGMWGRHVGTGPVAKAAVLFVCSGNTCRSPLAEAVLRHKLAAFGLGDRAAVDSAGLAARNAGGPPDPRAIACGARRGYDLRDLRSRQFDAADYRAFDLILAMDRGQLRAMIPQRPARARARLALLLEFAPAPPQCLDVPDPYDGGAADYDQALDLIEPAVAGLIHALWRA